MTLSSVNGRDIQPEIYNRDQHNISRSNIDPDALKIMYRLIRHGFKAYLVGGGVRDLLLEKKPKDFDIATDATPRRVKALFRNSRIIGRRFKLVHIFFGNHKIIEVSTFRDVSDPIEPLEEAENREDEKVPLLHDNKYGTEQTDAVRRDITINGLFYDLATFSIIDYVGGMRDLQDKLIRIIGEPDVRFKEDPVRLMRVVRHAARTGFTVEERCWNSLLKNHTLLTQSSQVRVYEELKKDLCSGYALKIFKLLREANLLALLLPELTEGNNSLLLESPSPFATCLERADQAVLDGENISPTVILALVMLFTDTVGSESQDSLLSKFDGSVSLYEHVKRCFVKLSVPRKERERIEGLLSLWYRLERQPKQARSLNRSAHYSDLLSLLKIFNPKHELLEIMPAAESGREPHRERHHQPRLRKRASGRQRGRRW